MIYRDTKKQGGIVIGRRNHAILIKGERPSTAIDCTKSMNNLGVERLKRCRTSGWGELAYSSIPGKGGGEEGLIRRGRKIWPVGTWREVGG